MNDVVTQVSSRAVGGVCGIDPERKEAAGEVVIWRIEWGARRNYIHLGKQLATRNESLYRNGSADHGLIHVLANGDQRLITKASQLAPLIVDSFSMKVMKEGKVVSELPQAGHLNNMLHAEAFLSQFRPVDQVARTALYLDDFTLVQPGYHDNGPRRRLLYLGPKPNIADSLEIVERFLGVMAFASNADRTNTVAAALTVLLRHRWAGEKPVVLVTATKSHAGKGTITDFIRGAVPKAEILYENTDWPMQSQLQRQIGHNPEVGMISLDNVRSDSGGGRAKCIRSGFIESFVTTPEVILAAPGVGELARLKNWFVVTINSNDGSLSPDLMATTETERLRFRLDGGIRRRVKGGNGHQRYVFEVLEREPLPVQDQEPPITTQVAKPTSPAIGKKEDNQFVALA